MLWRATQGAWSMANDAGRPGDGQRLHDQLYIPLGFLGVIYREDQASLTDLDKMFTLMEKSADCRRAGCSAAAYQTTCRRCGLSASP
jgi:ATP-binding cassette subfamily B protein